MPLPPAAKPFEERAEEYDSWFDQSLLFDIEIAAIKAVKTNLQRPGLEVGVGPGRFAQALRIEFGIDPALSPLKLANHRSIMTINGVGENLPFRTQSIGTVYILFTLCFLPDPAEVIREVFRVLKTGGHLVIGFIPAQSAWGRNLAKKGKENHPYYRFARFRTVSETMEQISRNGLEIIESWSTLFQPPSPRLEYEQPKSGLSDEAGFCILTSRKKGESRVSC